MNATCISGSARLNGSSAFLTDTLIRGMKSAGIETKKYSIGECNINYCVGCKKCYIDGRCFQNDDVYKIVCDIINSDYVSIVAPSYWAGVPGQLKVFFDRNTPYGDTNPNRILKIKKPAKGIAIAIRAGTRESENELILDSIQHYFGHLGIETIKRVSVCKTDTLEDLLNYHKDIIDEVYELGAKINNYGNQVCLGT